MKKMQGADHLQFEECVRDLKHEDMRVAVVMDDEDTLNCPPHAKIFIVILQPLESSGH